MDPMINEWARFIFIELSKTNDSKLISIALGLLDLVNFLMMSKVS